MQAEGDDLVRRIVADIRPPEPWNSGALAPISGDRLRLGPERTVIFGDVADAPQPQPRQPARSKIAGDMKEGAIEGVEIFAHLLDQQDMARKIGLQRGAEIGRAACRERVCQYV